MKKTPMLSGSQNLNPAGRLRPASGGAPVGSAGDAILPNFRPTDFFLLLPDTLSPNNKNYLLCKKSKTCPQ
jgi:hypothetical protein